MITSIRKILTLIMAFSLFLASCGVDNSATQSSAYKEREDSHEGFEEHMMNCWRSCLRYESFQNVGISDR